MDSAKVGFDYCRRQANFSVSGRRPPKTARKWRSLYKDNGFSSNVFHIVIKIVDVKRLDLSRHECKQISINMHESLRLANSA